MHNIYKRTCSVWSLLRAGNKNFHNLLYMPGSEQVSRAPGPAFQAFPLAGTGEGAGGLSIALGSDMVVLQVLHPVCHVRALHLWTAVYLPASSPHPLGQEDMDIYMPPGSQSQDFSGRCLDR